MRDHPKKGFFRKIKLSDATRERARKLIVHIAVRLLHIWFSTCRVRIIGKQYHDRYITMANKTVGATWHRGAIFIVWFFRKYRPMVMISQSKDGDLMAGFAEKLGCIPVRGSSSRGGRAALKEMRSYMSKPGDRRAATVLDGPRGPRFVAKKGMINLAMSAKVPLIPVMVSAHPAITLKNAWDKTMIPLPFSKVTVMYGKPWQISGNLSSEALEALRRDVESTLNKMMETADRLTGYNKAAKAYYRGKT